MIASLLLATLIFCACDDTTDEIGTSLINRMDNLQVSTDTFTVTTRSIAADSVLSRNTIGYIGKVRDPETGAYITGNFMTQFHTLENYEFPAANRIESRINGEIVADSCEIRLYYTDFYGDSLATMTLIAHEMSKPMEEGTRYYSNFDPKENGYIRGTEGIHLNKTYTLCDLNVDISERQESDYTNNIKISLNEPYTDRDGNTYNNFGTYLMRKYYEDPTNYKNSYNFVHRLVPGFYFENVSGLGSMAYISVCQLNVYFRYDNGDSISVGTSSFAGTEEVLQTSKLTNDKESIKRLLTDNTCTYLKTPAGIFTEMTLPVEDIIRGHETDSINIAKVSLQRINGGNSDEYTLDIPQTLIMIPTDSIHSFFDNNEIANYKTSFLATYNSSSNAYTFNNIQSLIRYMHNLRQQGNASENWNKVVIIPVTTTYNTTGQTNELTKVVHDMSMTSTKLVGGSANPNGPIKLSVIYSKFQ